MKKKACKRCRIFVEGDECPICKGNNFVSNWQGRVYITDAQKSFIAKKTKKHVNGEYAIKVK